MMSAGPLSLSARKFSNVPTKRGDHSKKIRPFLLPSNTNEPFFKQRRLGGIILTVIITFSPNIAYCGCDRHGPIGPATPLDENERFDTEAITFVDCLVV